MEITSSSSESEDLSECPVCQRKYQSANIESHVNECFENQVKIKCSPSSSLMSSKRQNEDSVKTFGIFNRAKKVKIESQVKKETDIRHNSKKVIEIDDSPEEECVNKSTTTPKVIKTVDPPLADAIRPISFDDYVGQKQIIGENSIFRNLLKGNNINSMIFWGPPGCGKTTLAHIIASHCNNEKENFRFVKLSACTSGIGDVKEVVKQAKSHRDTFKKRTILFMDEIHRFNKLQQDAFLPHVENGTIILLGATTENPSFSLNSALLSRCRVIVLEKLESSDLVKILQRALVKFKAVEVSDKIKENFDFVIEYGITSECLKWIADISDGDARIALNSLEMCIKQAKVMKTDENENKLITLDDVKEGVKKSHLLYDRAGDQHYDIISALHKSIRASDDNAALYWASRMIVAGEDPRFIVRRLIRAASEDIGLADPNALILATSTLQAVQHVGMPEADCIIAQLVVYLARAPKSTESYFAFKKCKEMIKEHKGILPSVPLHLRNAPTRLMSDLGYGDGYNRLHKDQSGLNYLPEELEDIDFFN